jgi:hypothetical protein
MRRRYTRQVSSAVLLILTASLGFAPALAESPGETCDCDFSAVPGAVYWSTDPQISLAELAAYLAPVFWFSPDEPSLRGRRGAELTVPEAMPFEEAAGPVVYYQLTKVYENRTIEFEHDSATFTPDPADEGASLLYLPKASLMTLEFYAYFADEAGFGAHRHDVEVAEFRLVVMWSDGNAVREYVPQACGRRHYIVAVTRVTGKAHGIEWYWNVLETDEDTQLPVTLLVEEGKHALATDKNGDGYFTPSYDVNVRVNDAWGVRDIIRSGGLFSAGYQAWMTKVRHPDHLVLPPLPPDSPLVGNLETSRAFQQGEHAVYELRPLPSAAEAAAWDAAQGPGSRLASFIVGKEVPDGPKMDHFTTIEQAVGWVRADTFKKSLSIALYADGDLGVSWSFPFFVVKHLHVPMTGGYVLHRMYLKDERFRDAGWTLMYTSSASRWFDPYLAAGYEKHVDVVDDVETLNRDFVFEVGFKLRTQVGTSPLSFLSFLTDFWGVRLGMKNYGFFDVDRINYVIEVGAGSF